MTEKEITHKTIEKDRQINARNEIRRIVLEETNKYVAEPIHRDAIIARAEARLKSELKKP